MDAIQENLAVILDHVGDGVTVQDSAGRLVYANAAARALGSASPADLLATSLSELADRFSLLDKAGEPIPREQLPGAARARGRGGGRSTVRSISHATGEERWSVVRSSAVRDPSGRVLFAVNVWQDATAQMRAAEAQGFLVDAGEALATSLDVEATLVNIAELSVPRLADWCAVHLVRDEDRFPDRGGAYRSRTRGLGPALAGALSRRPQPCRRHRRPVRAQAVDRAIPDIHRRRCSSPRRAMPSISSSCVGSVFPPPSSCRC